MAAILLAAALIPGAVTQGAMQAGSTDPDLDSVRQEMGKLRSRLRTLRAQAKTAEQEMEVIQLELAIRSREAAMAIEIQTEVDSDLVEAERRLGLLNEEIDRQRRHLSGRMSTLYRLGGLSYLRILMSLDSKTSPLEAISMLTYMIGRDARAVARFQASRRVLAERQAELSTRRARVDLARRDVERSLQAMAEAQKEKEAVLTRLQSESTVSARRLAELEEKARRLERLFSLLYGHHGEHSTLAVSIAEFQGALEWPVRGAILEAFGPHRNPRFATVTVNNGMKIEAAAGSPVHAIFHGTVLFSQWFKGYGTLVIVDHGNRVFSLYGNTQSPRVSVGDRITPRQVIATVADTEDQTRAYLYFEMRENNKPTNPGKWLR